MSRRREYPRWGGDSPLTAPCECAACDKPAVVSVGIEWDWMRGEDSYVPACRWHKKMALNEVKRFVGHINSKDKFLASKNAAPAEGAKS